MAHARQPGGPAAGRDPHRRVKPFTGDVRAGDRVIYVTTDRNRVTAMAGTDAAG